MGETIKLVEELEGIIDDEGNVSSDWALLSKVIGIQPHVLTII
jgi:hypothetical protein